MDLYILRHAIAIPRGTRGYPNDDRPLTGGGIKKMKKAARGCKTIVSGFDHILTSPLKRAYETASIMANEFGCEDSLNVCDLLLPGTPAKSLLADLDKRKLSGKILLVGHEPDLGLLASSLLGRESSIIEFKKGALCYIRIESPLNKKQGELVWHLPPKFLRALSERKK